MTSYATILKNLIKCRIARLLCQLVRKNYDNLSKKLCRLVRNVCRLLRYLVDMLMALRYGNVYPRRVVA